MTPFKPPASPPMQYAVIAAGQGARLRAAELAVPKPLALVAGRPMLARLVDGMAACGAARVTVVANPDTPAVVALLRSGALPVAADVVELRSAFPLQSLDAALGALAPGRFILATVDAAVAPEALAAYARTFARLVPDHAGLMAVTPRRADESGLYVHTSPDGLITRFSDAPDGATRLSAGIYGLHTAPARAALDRCLARGERRLRDFQRELLASGTPLHAFDIGPAVDVDSPADLLRANAIFNE